jgi:hypothetical protein
MAAAAKLVFGPPPPPRSTFQYALRFSLELCDTKHKTIIGSALAVIQ